MLLVIEEIKTWLFFLFIKCQFDYLKLSVVLKGGVDISELTIVYFSIPPTNGIMYYSNDVICRVWEKAIPVMNQNPVHIRKDACGAWIVYEAYGNRKSEYGWEIDHIIPIAHGGTDDYSNLQPLHWDNNVAKGDGTMVCKVTAGETHNRIVPFWNIIFE